VGSLFGLKERDPQARLLDRDLLKFVVELRLIARAIAHDLVGGGEKAPARSDFLRVSPQCEAPEGFPLAPDVGPRASS